MSIELKIKSKHLTEEARIIRFEEKKLKARAKTKLLASLRNHRTKDVRRENRSTFLARAYIAGVPYSTVENHRSPENESTFVGVVLRRTLAMIQKYSNPQTRMNDVLVWVGFDAG